MKPTERSTRGVPPKGRPSVVKKNDSKKSATYVIESDEGPEAAQSVKTTGTFPTTSQAAPTHKYFLSSDESEPEKPTKATKGPEERKTIRAAQRVNNTGISSKTSERGTPSAPKRTFLTSDESEPDVASSDECEKASSKATKMSSRVRKPMSRQKASMTKPFKRKRLAATSDSENSDLDDAGATSSTSKKRKRVKASSSDSDKSDSHDAKSVAKRTLFKPKTANLLASPHKKTFNGFPPNEKKVRFICSCYYKMHVLINVF